MTNDQIIEMAKDAGLTCYGGSKQSSGLHSWHAYTNHLEAFARLIAEKQREEDAGICMGLCSVIEEPHEFERCAAAIRNSGGAA
jgi:hypothetical protein